jgi:hypothetical protein
VGSISLVESNFAHVAWLLLEELSIGVPFLRASQDVVGC